MSEAGTQHVLLVVSMKEGLGSSVVWGWDRLGAAGGVVVASRAHVSIAPLVLGDFADGRARSGGAFPKGAVRRLDDEGRLPERRVGCG